MINARRGYSIIFLSFFSIVVFCQSNLVPNGSFENYNPCPSSIGEVSDAFNWTSLKSTPDYYNSCSTSTGNCYLVGQLIASVPYNCFGFQYAASGNAYMGFASFSVIGGNYREILGAQLTSSMTIGQKYFVKFKVSLTLDNSSNSCSDKLGVRFSTVQHNSVTALPPINNFAHIYTTSMINDTLNWTTVFKTFIADSNYLNVEVGNFFDDANTNYVVLKPQATNTSYYYFDDFCVSTDSLFSLNYTTNIDNQFSDYEFRIYPNPTNHTLMLENSYKNERYEIINVVGTIVKHGVCKNERSEIDVSDLSNGLYFVVVREKKMKLLISH